MSESKKRRARYGALYGTAECPGALRSPIRGWKPRAPSDVHHQKDVNAMRMRRRERSAS